MVIGSLQWRRGDGASRLQVKWFNPAYRKEVNNFFKGTPVMAHWV